jgi:hypothetical protein
MFLERMLTSKDIGCLICVNPELSVMLSKERHFDSLADSQCHQKMAERDRLEDLRVDGGIILKWTLNTRDGRMWTRPVEDRDT